MLCFIEQIFSNQTKLYIHMYINTGVKLHSHQSFADGKIMVKPDAYIACTETMCGHSQDVEHPFLNALPCILSNHT